MNIEDRISNYLLASGTPPTRFGREAVRDPRLVRDIRGGRNIGRKLRIQLDRYLSQKGQ